MNLTELYTALETSISVNTPEVTDIFMDDKGIINATHKVSYPCVWIPYPTKTKLQNKRGYEDFAFQIGVYDVKGQKTLSEIRTRMDELEAISYKIYRDLHTDNTDIIGYKSGLTTNMFDNLFSDRVIGIETSFTLEIWTGWDCNT